LFELERYDLAWAGSRLVWIGGPEAWISPEGERWTLAVTVDGCEEFSRFVGVLGTPVGRRAQRLRRLPGDPAGARSPALHLDRRRHHWAITWRDVAGGSRRWPGCRAPSSRSATAAIC